MLEGSFRKDLQRGLQAQGAWVYKIPDLSRGQLKPCDLVVGYQGQLILIECKLRKLNRQKPIGDDDIAISYKDFRSHQIPTLMDIYEKDQAVTYVAACLVNVQEPRKKWAWILSAYSVPNEEAWTVGELMMPEWEESRLDWVPNIGWQWRRLDALKSGPGYPLQSKQEEVMHLKMDHPPSL